MRQRRFSFTFLALLLMASTIATAQGLPSAQLLGRVTNEGLGLPGVQVLVSSPNLQGTRTAVTSSTGDYVFPNLPPGDYSVEFTISGFGEQKRAVRLAASQQVPLNVSMSLTAIATEATVVAEKESISTATQASTTFSGDILNKLPTNRTLLAAVALTAGVNQNGPNGNVTISGGQSFDNLFTINGVVVTDNIRGTPFNLFVEDAIQETTTSTSAVSAEFGRFTGGVVNAITKSGGNTFSGTFRTTLTNDAWTAISPLNETRLQDVIPRYEATLGGPAIKDRIWFFGNARLEDRSLAANTNVYPNYPVDSFTQTIDEKRYEGKLTLTPFQSHTLVGSYTKIDLLQSNNFFANAPILDLKQLNDRELPQELISVNYNGVLTNSLFVEGQYSRRKFTFKNDGSRFTDLLKGTPILDQSRGNGYSNSPIFCGVCEPEERNNRNYLAKATYFLTTPGLGSHNIVVGYDNFSGDRLSNNHQSGSNYDFRVSTTIKRGTEVFPVVDGAAYLVFWPIQQPSQGSDLLTHSVFVNDSWRLSNRLSFNVGVRYDKNDAKDSVGATIGDDSAFSPRLAATYDVTGTGNLRVNASYAKYIGAITENQVGAASAGGTPSLFYWYWLGPDINTGSGALLSAEQVLAQVFAFYGIRAPGDFPTNGQTPDGARVPGVNVQFRNSLRSPNALEYTIGVSGAIGSRGSFRVDGVYRKFGDFYGQVGNTSTGIVTDSLGRRFDLRYVENTEAVERKYTGLHTSFSYRVTNALNFGGNWTWSHSIGNFDGETSGAGPVATTVEVYPEYKEARWNNPVGDLAIDQRHRIRVFATYDVPLPKSVGQVSASVLQTYDTGVPYGAVGAVASRRNVTNPGYVSPPASVTYFYTSRDAFRTDNVTRTDVSLNYSKTIGPVEVFLQPQIVNLFNNQSFGGDFRYFNTTVEDATSRPANYVHFNPFTSTPVQGARNTGANWNLGPNFGRVTNQLGYQQPRTFRVSMGLRF